MIERKIFKGSATELASELSKILCKEIFANHIKKELMKHAYELQSYGVTFESKRSNGQRVIILKYDKNSDTSDGKKLMPQAVDSTDPVENEKVCKVRWTTLDEILNESAGKIRSKLASQGIEVPPFKN
ncbi:MAG: hypothetical protein ACI4JB_04165 [Porcipelethomonas sp.]